MKEPLPSLPNPTSLYCRATQDCKGDEAMVLQLENECLGLMGWVYVELRNENDEKEECVEECVEEYD